MVTLSEDGVISIYKIGEGGDHSIKMWGYEIKGKGSLKVEGDKAPYAYSTLDWFLNVDLVV